jgi:hypothetical protein
MKVLSVWANMAVPGEVFWFPIKVRPATLGVGRLEPKVFSFAPEVFSGGFKVISSAIEVLYRADKVMRMRFGVL